MNWKQLLAWLWDHYQDILQAGTTVLEFYQWAAEQIEALLNKTPDQKVEQVTDEMMDELQASWAGPLPPFPTSEVEPEE